MKTFKLLFAAILLYSLSSMAFAAKNPISVHVLNLQDGLPSPNVTVTLERKDGDAWDMLNSGATNEQGRINALYPDDESLEKGVYRVTFETGDWFEKHDAKTFFPKVPVVFTVDGSVPHYHIPLLLSPYGYSTYRGN